MYGTDNLLNDKNNKRCLIQIIWEMKFEVEFQLTIQFSLLLQLIWRFFVNWLWIGCRWPAPFFLKSLMLTNF